MSIYYNQIRAMVAAKAPRVMSEMAHYHRNKDDLKLEGKALAAADKLFCYTECVTPPPAHPSDPSSLCVEFVLEIGKGNCCKFWADDSGEFTDDPDKARKVPKSWDYNKESRSELRTLAYDGVRKCKEIAKELGVPKGVRIYDNLP